MSDIATAEEVPVVADDGYQAAIPEGWRRLGRWTPEQKRLARRRRLNRRVWGRGVAHIKQITWLWLLGLLTYGAVQWGPSAWQWATYEPAKPEPVYLVHLHVSYNSVTDGHSKVTEEVGPRMEFYLQGMGRLKSGIVPEGPEAAYRCRVSPEYWRMVSENSFHDIPADRCQRFDP
mgnify:FL=1